MACGLSKSFGLSSSLKRSGIVTILSGECDSGISSNTSASSLRRTFSADMSSKYLLSRNGFCPMKTSSLSEEIRSFVTDSQCSSGEEDEGLGGGGGTGEEDSRSAVDIWAHIQEEKKNKKMDEERPGQSGVWSSILSQKSEPIKMVAPPYVHPIVKQFSSSLSKKSLEICTESLGSETGSDGFSWFPSPEAGDTEEEKVNKQDEPQKVVAEAKDEDQSEAEHETWVANSNTSTTSCKKLSRGGSFPPPIPSLSNQSGKSLLMKTRRDNGRLVLEAVSLPSQNNFCAKRQDGRLVLTFTDSKDNTDDANEKEREDESRNSEVLWFNEEDEEGEGEEDAESPNGFVSVHRLAHKAIGIPNRNPRWSDKDEPSGKSKVTALVAQSLPPRPRLAHLARVTLPPSTVDDTVGAACFNTYNYYWRPTTPPKIDTKPSIQNATAQDSLKKLTVSSGGRSNDGWLNGCKEQRRSLLFFELYCIATS